MTYLEMENRKVPEGEVKWVGWMGDNGYIVFLLKNSLIKRKCLMECCHDATAHSLVAKVQGKVIAHFHAVSIKCHNSMRN
jgi:hypothetical protein